MQKFSADPFYAQVRQTHAPDFTPEKLHTSTLCRHVRISHGTKKHGVAEMGFLEISA